MQGLSHITFIVRDLERAAAFFKSVFQAREVYASGEQGFSLAPERFLLVGDLWIALMEGDPLQERSYNHIAFRIKEEEFELYKARVEVLGLEVRPSRPRAAGEGRSLYFYDYDNHLFELHTGTLEERLKAYASLDAAKQRPRTIEIAADLRLRACD